MEIKSTLNYPYTEEERIQFIITENHNKGYEIRYEEIEIEGEKVTNLQAWGYTEEEKAQQERNRKDNMTLTPADVERALYKAKSIDFDDLITMIEETMTSIDMKALKIEFKASLFYRGAKFGNGRLFDVIGNMLGYTSDDMDYLFEHKELPVKNTVEEVSNAE